MREKGFTLRELAESSGLSIQGLQRILKENTTKVDTLEAIAKKLDVPVNIFFEEDRSCVSFADHGSTAVSGKGNRTEIGEQSFSVSEKRGEYNPFAERTARVETIIEARDVKASYEATVSELKKRILDLESRLVDKECIIESLRANIEAKNEIIKLLKGE